MNPVTKTFQYGGQTVTLETGRIARQATGAVLVTVENTSVLVYRCGRENGSEGRDFFPLAVHYIEKTYSVGKIPGGFFKREARPSEKETLTSRLIDRPIRPLFPNGFMNEVQVSLYGDVCRQAHRSGYSRDDWHLGSAGDFRRPFNGPIGGARVGFSEANGYMLNPTYDELAESKLDMIVAGTDDAVLMVESEAKELTEDQMLGCGAVCPPGDAGCDPGDQRTGC